MGHHFQRILEVLGVACIPVIDETRRAKFSSVLWNKTFKAKVLVIGISTDV